jgi:stage II sporulation protein D
MTTRHFLHTARRPSLLLSAGAAALAVAVAPVFVASAHGQQVSPVPTTRVFHVKGHGWGHGHGMSQDGAYGAAAVKHLSASQILSFYYPHTAAGSISNPLIRILLQGTASNYVQIGTPAGASAVLKLHDLASGYQANLPTAPTMWRVIAGTSSISVQQFVSGTWEAWAPAGHETFAGPVDIGSSNSTSAASMRVVYPSGTERDYRGWLRNVRAASSNIDTMAIMNMDDYLRGVVPRESPSSWPAAALQAQAVAARSYAEYEREHAGSSDHDICDSTSCQVFGGTTEVSSSGQATALEAASTNSAVSATAGQVRTYGGKAIFAQYSADDGGWTTDGGAPYLIAQADPYASLGGFSSYYWSANLPASALEAANPSIGSLVRIRATARDGHGDWGGRVTQVVLEGTKGSVTVPGSAVSSAYSWPSHSDGLRSSWWEILPTAAADFDGNGATNTSVWRPSTAEWFDIGHSPVQYGAKGDQPVAGDYNGDGRVDRAVWRPSTQYWYILGVGSAQWGLAGDIPVPADYNGDGKTDLAVFRPSNGVWYIRGIATITYGRKGDVPVPGDYDGDGHGNIAVWRPSTHQWFVYGVKGFPQTWGVTGDIPVPADYRGFGAVEPTVWRPSTGQWWIHDGRAPFTYGQKGDVPVPGDYDGNGAAQPAVFRPSNATWYRYGAGSAAYGTSTDEPVPLPYAIYRVR